VYIISLFQIKISLNQLRVTYLEIKMDLNSRSVSLALIATVATVTSGRHGVAVALHVGQNAPSHTFLSRFAASAGVLPVSHRSKSSKLFSSPLGYDDDALEKILADAKKLVQETKNKIELKSDDSKEIKSPADASVISSGVKSSSTMSEEERRIYLLGGGKPDARGKIRPSAELMEKLAEEEDWELRMLDEMFEDQIPQPTDMEKKLQKKDIGMTMYNLRKSMQNEDFRKIFNSKNPRIGEE